MSPSDDNRHNASQSPSFFDANAAPAGQDRIILWPNHSLGHSGIKAVIAVAGVGFGLALIRTWQMHAWPLFLAIGATFAGFAFAFSRFRHVRIAEIIDIDPQAIIIRRAQHGREQIIGKFNPHWVRVQLYTDRYVKNRLVLSESGRRLSIGGFLSPPERHALATDLQARLVRLRRLRDVDS